MINEIASAITDRTIKRLCVVNGLLAVVLGVVSVIGIFKKN